jgi:CheY-like chemotaxis protein
MSETSAVPRILVAEDDDLLAETVVEVLEQEGYTVMLAGDGLTALAIAAASPFDALLTDVRMPHMDGIALIQRMRADNPTLPIVVMSGHAPPDIAATIGCSGSGPFVTLLKPMSMRSLVAAVMDVLGHRVESGVSP